MEWRGKEEGGAIVNGTEKEEAEAAQHGRRKARRPFQEAKAEKKKALWLRQSLPLVRVLSRVCFFTDGGIVESFWMEACYVPPCFSTYYLEALFRPRREVLRLRA